MSESKTVFVVKMKYFGDRIKYPCRLSEETLGYFTDLEKAEYYIQFPKKETYWFLEYHPFKIYEIEEYGMDYFFLWINTRIYDSEGKLIGEKPCEEAGFYGREKKDCQFKPGDWVQFVDGNQLDVGIVCGLPPDKKRVKEINKEAGKHYDIKGSMLDYSDDSYLVLDGLGKHDHSHPHVAYCFKPQNKIKEQLRSQLQKRYDNNK